MMRQVGIVVITLMAMGCGGGNKGAIAPDPTLGPSSSVTLCGSIGQAGEPCSGFPTNEIALRVNKGPLGGTLTCPCFSFSFLNQALSDLGSGIQDNYGFTGFNPGTYTVTGQFKAVGTYDFSFNHNSSTGAIGIVPSSFQSLTGPVKTSNASCTVGYTVTNTTTLPASFSFQFTVAASASGGSC